jgi:hypothetical protein
MAQTDIAITAETIDEASIERRADRRDRWLTVATFAGIPTSWTA